MRKEEFFEVLGELDDDIVKEAGSNRKENRAGRPAWVRWGALAACLCLAAVGVFATVHLRGTGGAPVPDPNGTIECEPGPNEYPSTNIVPGFTLDEPDSGNDVFPAVFNDVDAAPVGKSAMIALMGEDFCPMSAEESLDYFGITLPEDGIVPGLELTGGGCFGDGHGVYRRGDRGVYFDVNYYEFTGSGKSVILTLCTRFHLIPLEQVANGPEHIDFTEIRGWELALFRYTDENGVQCVYTEFVLDGVTCTVSASGLGNNELALVLISLLPYKEYVPGPVTVTGTVTHVDSRTGDYFDGTEHHYSEDHDYITVDCGGTSLTVWLPGEADRFSVGDSVTVTYNGEPATAYNIWPGQLVSVE